MDTNDLNNTINQLDLTHIYRTLHSTTTEYAFFSSTHGTLSNIEKLVLINLKEQKSCKACSLTTMDKSNGTSLCFKKLVKEQIKP